MSVAKNVLNATGELDGLLSLIDEAFVEASETAQKLLKLTDVDVVFLSAANYAIPELGIGGNTPGPNHVYLSLDPHSDKLTKEHVVESLLHEFHHTMRWRNPGYGETLGEALVTEGLACLFEEEVTGNRPIYTNVQLDKATVSRARQEYGNRLYDHNAWFFGTSNIQRWFGYAYGYQLCRAYANTTKKTAAELIHTPATEILG